MNAINRRTLAQAAVTAGVLVAGIIASTTAGNSPGAATHRAGAAAPAVETSPSAAGSTAATHPSQHASSPSYLHPTGHPANPAPDGVIPATGRHAGHVVQHLTHPAHEPWSHLLAAAPAGWTTTFTAKPLTPKVLGKGTPNPAMAAKSLRFDGFRRGAVRTVRGSRYGVVEQIWQFRRQSGAQAVFLASAAVARAHRSSGRVFFIGHHGDFGAVAADLDSTGYHYGIGLALDGDMFVSVRVFGTAPVKRSEITVQLRRAERPVARGISQLGVVAGSNGASTPSPSSVTT